jgi:hypothetical protein
VNLKFQKDYEILKIGERYIQLVKINIQEKSLIICFTTDQAKAFVKQIRFNINLSYKRTKGAYYEFIIINFDKKYQKRKIYF